MSTIRNRGVRNFLTMYKLMKMSLIIRNHIPLMTPGYNFYLETSQREKYLLLYMHLYSLRYIKTLIK